MKSSSFSGKRINWNLAVLNSIMNLTQMVVKSWLAKKERERDIIQGLETRVSRVIDQIHLALDVYQTKTFYSSSSMIFSRLVMKTFILCYQFCSHSLQILKISLMLFWKLLNLLKLTSKKMTTLIEKLSVFLLIWCKISLEI